MLSLLEHEMDPPSFQQFALEEEDIAAENEEESLNGGGGELCEDMHDATASAQHDGERLRVLVGFLTHSGCMLVCRGALDTRELYKNPRVSTFELSRS